jgi:hypothetical protein
MLQVQETYVHSHAQPYTLSNLVFSHCGHANGAESGVVKARIIFHDAGSVRLL